MFDSVIFDLGGVLIDWNPRHLYRQLIPAQAEMEHFLSEVCTDSWQEKQNVGKPWSEAIAERVAFLSWFESIVVSGDVGISKPSPIIYRHLFEKYGLAPETAIFVDD